MPTNNDEKCRKCGGNTKWSKAFGNAYIVELHQTTIVEGGGDLIACLKCEDCGHSFVPSKV